MNPGLPFSARLALVRTRAANALVWAVLQAVPMASRHRTGLVTLLSVAIFFGPALIYGADMAGSGDILGWYLPALAKTHALLHSLTFTAIDYSSFNGSSDFFLSPNFFAFHPLVVLFSLLAPAARVTANGIALLLTAMLAFHSALAVYFSLRLLTRFFAFEFPVALFATMLFAFSPYMVLNAATQTPFYFAATIVPWAIYAGLSYAHAPGGRHLLFAALPVVFAFTAGYLPLGVACLMMAAVVIAAQILLLAPAASLEQRLHRLLASAAPFVLGAAVVALYLYSVFAFHRETSSAGAPSLFFSAHQLADVPQSILRIFSTHIPIPGPLYEFTLYWGMVAVVTAVLFVFTPRTLSLVPAPDWTLLKLAACIYFLTVLAGFGQHSAVSNLVYYFVPQVGKMHIYQRFLLPAHFMFAIMVALMLRTLVDLRPPRATRVAVAVLGLATLGTAFAVAFHGPAAQAYSINNFAVFELGLAFLFSLCLLVPGRTFVFVAATVLASLPMLGHMYDRSQTQAVFQNNQRERVALDPQVRGPFIDWIKRRFPDRDVIKYVDITPMWNAKGLEPFPKVFPFFVLNELPLSSYGGFTFYLSSRADYLQHMPVGGDVKVMPDWDYVAASGADFVVAYREDLKGPLGEVAARAGTAADDLYTLPYDVIVVPLRPRASPRLAADGTRYDNGMFRVAPAGFDMGKLRRTNLAVGKTATQSSDGGAPANRAVDGKTNGDFAAGSVSHTGRDQNAWLDIDLGAVEQVDEVKLWNRTDAAGYRLNDYWVFVSEEPFQPADTATALRSRPGVWSVQGRTPSPATSFATGGVRGRYVRVQYDGKQPLENSFLALAEVEVFRWNPEDAARAREKPNGQVKVNAFRTDLAQWADFDFEVTAPSTVDYLFWDNPRVSFRLDGESVRPVRQDGVFRLAVAPGRHTLELRYRHWPLRLFWLVYGLYFVALLAALAWPLRARWRARRSMPSPEQQQ